MDRNYCYLIHIEHPDAVSEEYVVINLEDLYLCIKEYMNDYSVYCSEPLDVLIKRVYLKGGSADGKKKNEK